MRLKRSTGTGFSSEIETFHCASTICCSCAVARGPASHLRLKRLQSLLQGKRVHVARGPASHLRLKLSIKSSLPKIQQCSTGTGFSSEIETYRKWPALPSLMQ